MTSAKAVPSLLVERSADVRAAVLLDPAGGLLASSVEDAKQARRFAELAYDLVRAADSATGEPTEQIEAQVEQGAVFAVRSAHHTLACAARRLALPALILYDLRQALLELEGAR